MSFDEAGRAAEENLLRDLLARIEAARQATASPMVDTNLRVMHELCLHSLVFFSTDTPVHPYLD